MSINTNFALLANVLVMIPIHSHNVRCSSALPIAADMLASERLAVRMMLLAVQLVGITSKNQTLAMIIIDGISFLHR